MIFQGISVARNYPALSAVLVIKTGLSQQNYKGRHFSGIVAQIFSNY